MQIKGWDGASSAFTVSSSPNFGIQDTSPYGQTKREGHLTAAHMDAHEANDAERCTLRTKHHILHKSGKLAMHTYKGLC